VQTKKSQAGFSLAEMLVVLGVLMVGGAVTIMNVSGAVRGAHVETAYQNTLNQLRLARQIAIDKRTVCRVDFAAPGTVSVTQAFTDGTPVQTETITLPADVQYVVVAGMPTPPAATPDNIGNGTVAIDFDRVKAGGGTTIFSSLMDPRWTHWACRMTALFTWPVRTNYLGPARLRCSASPDVSAAGAWDRSPAEAWYGSKTQRR
jgi:type II secretory pathway pseudopilin PulG